MTKLFFLCAFLYAGTLSAQSISMDAIGFCGDTFVNPSAQLSFTGGEVMATSYSTGNTILCEGFQQTYITYWVGNSSSNWTTPSNWNGGPVPDLNTDIVILAGRANNPAITSNQSCRSIQLRAGAILQVNSGNVLTVRN